ncbi:MAG: PAS domain S-box protein, partial [Rufibacter sp.]
MNESEETIGTAADLMEVMAPVKKPEGELLKALVESCPLPMVVLQADAGVVYANAAMASLCGISQDSLGKAGSELFQMPPNFSWASFPGQFSGNSTVTLEVGVVHQSGEVIPVEATASMMANTPGETLVSLYLRDLRPVLAEKEKTAQHLQTLEAALADVRFAINNSADLFCTFDLDGNFLDINNTCLTVLGYTPEDMIGRNYREFIHPDDILTTEDDSRLVQKELVTYNFKNRYLHKSGRVVYISWSTSYVPGSSKAYCTGRDISATIPAEARRQENENMLQALLQTGNDMVAIVDQQGVYTFVSGSIRNDLGFEPEELLGMKAFSSIHEEDLPDVLCKFEQVLKGQDVQTHPFRFKNSAGEWRWLETKAINCLHHPDIQGIVINSRDISDRLAAQKQLERSEKMYKALFDYNPDAVYSLDVQGYYTSVNKGALQMLGMREEDILQKHFNDFAHPDYKEENLLNFERVLKGEAVTTEAHLLDSKQEERIYTFTEIPIFIDGQVVGVHGLAKDITETKQQQKLLSDTAKRLNSILGSIKDAFFTIDCNWRFTYVNQEFGREMGVENEKLIGRDIREIFEPAKFGTFLQQFIRAFEKNSPIHFEEYSDLLQKWLDVSVYPSEEGLSVYIKCINSRKQAETELKKLSLVASKTVNSVYITDEHARIEWVNDGFTRISGYTLEEVLGKRPGDILASPFTSGKVGAIRQKLSLDLPFVQEVQNINKAGDMYWSKLDVTPIVDEHSGGAKKFIVIETVITEQKQAEEERVRLTEELLRRNHHLEQFTYIVSHNLRSPVANILGLTSLLTKTENQEMQKGLTDRLLLTAQNLDTIIRDLNDLLSLQGGLLQAREKLRLSEVVEQALVSLPNDSCQNVTVELNDIDEIVSVRSYLSSILSNLLSNAVKYKSPDRPLEIKVKATLKPEQNMLCLSVSDNGLGINLEKEGKNLFGLYKRFHFHVSGRGLGLYLVKTQAEAL